MPSVIGFNTRRAFGALKSHLFQICTKTMSHTDLFCDVYRVQLDIILLGCGFSDSNERLLV